MIRVIGFLLFLIGGFGFNMSLFTKKEKKDFFIVISVLLTLLITPIIVLLIMANRKYTFHLGTVFHQDNIVFLDNYGNFYISAREERLLFKHNSNLNVYYEVAKITINEKEYLSYNLVSGDEEYLYVGLNETDSQFLHYLCIYDRDLNLVSCWDTSELDWKVIEIDLYDNDLYLLSSYDNKLELYKVNIEENKRELLLNDIDDDSIYEDEEKLIYILYSSGFRKKGFRIKTERTEMFYVFENRVLGDLKIHLEGKNIEITNNTLIYKIDTGFDNPELYTKAYLCGNKLVFAVFDYLKKDDCGTYAYCICGYGKSKIYEFNVDSNEFFLRKEYNEGTFLIDYDLYGAKYYFNNKLFVNDAIQREIEDLKICEDVTMRGRWIYEEYYLYTFAYYNNEFYIIFSDIDHERMKAFL